MAVLGNINKFNSINGFIKEFKYYYQILVKLYKKERLIEFKHGLNNILNKLLDLNSEYFILLHNELISGLLLMV